MDKNENTVKTTIVTPENGLVSAIMVMVAKSAVEDSGVTGLIRMYIKDFSMFNVTTFTGRELNWFIETNSGNLRFEIVTDENPSETINGTVFETLMNAAPDRIKIKQIKVDPGVSHYIVNGKQCMSEISWIDNSWMFSMSDPESCDLMVMNHMALMHEAFDFNPTKDTEARILSKIVKHVNDRLEDLWGKLPCGHDLEKREATPDERVNLGRFMELEQLQNLFEELGLDID